MAADPARWALQVVRRELDGFERELALCPDDASLWRVVPGVTNSIGTLVLHVCGNLQHFVGRCLGGTDYVRDRDAEFSRRDATREALLQELRTTARVVDRVLQQGVGDALERPFPEAVGGVTLGTGLFLVHLAAHTAFHLGQAGYLRRALTGDARSAGPLPLKALAD